MRWHMSCSKWSQQRCHRQLAQLMHVHLNYFCAAAGWSMLIMMTGCYPMNRLHHLPQMSTISDVCLPQAVEVCPHSRTVGIPAGTSDDHATHSSGTSSLVTRCSGSLSHRTCHIFAGCHDSRSIRTCGISAHTPSSLLLSTTSVFDCCLHLAS